MKKVIAGMGLPMLTTQIPDTKRFRKELDAENRTVFRSTLFAPDKADGCGQRHTRNWHMK